MHPIYTDEAKSLLNESYPYPYATFRRGTLRKFLHDGSSVIFACQLDERSTASTLYTSGVDAAMVKLQLLLEPYLDLPSDGIFDGYTPVNAYPDGMNYWNKLLCAVTLVTMFDLLVALTYKYPERLSVAPEELRETALVYTMRPLVRTAKATRIVNSGRPFLQG